jgi:hypothetical protein
MNPKCIDLESCFQAVHHDVLEFPSISYAFYLEELNKHSCKEEAAKGSSAIHKHVPFVFHFLLLVSLSMAVLTTGFGNTSPARANDLTSISIQDVASISNQVARSRRKNFAATVVIGKPVVGKPGYYSSRSLGHCQTHRVNERPQALMKLYSKPCFQQVSKLEKNARTEASLKDEIAKLGLSGLKGIQTTLGHFRQRHLLRKANEALSDQKKAHQSMTGYWSLLDQIGSAYTAGRMHSISEARLEQACHEHKNSEKKAEESLKRYRRAHQDKLVIVYQSLE